MVRESFEMKILGVVANAIAALFRKRRAIFVRLENSPFACNSRFVRRLKSVARFPGLDKDFRSSLTSFSLSSGAKRRRENERP